MRRSYKITASVSVVALVSVAGVSLAQRQIGPKARYAMDVETVTGFGGMGGGMGGAMSMMFGGGGSKETHLVHLRLGSSLAPSGGGQKADHFPPATMKSGKLLPLSVPVKTESEWGGTERPKGRLLLFWGCGAKAGKGQPVVIDFARIAAGQMPPGLMSVRVPKDRGPTASNSKTFGEWPSGKGGKQPGKGSTLLGEHRVAGNYAPEIKYTLAQDYMGGVNTSTASQPGGSIKVDWNSVTQATGYHAWAMGGKMGPNEEMGDMVWWSSSSAKEFGGGLWEWLSPATVQNLIGQKVVMPSSQTSCTIPAEVKAAAPDFLMGNLVAYGPEVNFSYPPKPADPKAVWNIDWTTKVRFRSMTSWMEGMPGMGGAATAEGSAEQPKKKKCKPSIFGAVTGIGC